MEDIIQQLVLLYARINNNQDKITVRQIKKAAKSYCGVDSGPMLPSHTLRTRCQTLINSWSDKMDAQKDIAKLVKDFQTALVPYLMVKVGSAATGVSES